MKIKLTDDRIDVLKATGKWQELWDTTTPGLVLRVSPEGAKSFSLRYRHDGKRERYTLGKSPPLTLKKARELARPVLVDISAGIDPKGARAPVVMVADAIEIYITKGLKGKRPRHTAEVRRILQTKTAKWSKRSIAEIDAADVTRLLNALERHRWHVFSALRAFFKYCRGAGLIETSPISEDYPAPPKPKARDRVLDDKELRQVWFAVTERWSSYNSIIQLLILTGQRKEEAAGARWSEFNLDAATWSLPASRTKNGLPHIVPLSPQAVQVIQNVPRTASPYLFPGEGAKNPTFSGWSRCKARLDERCDVADWNIHDLRRSVVSGMTRLGIAPHVIERAVNHVSGVFGGVAGVYNREQLLKERREALDLWGHHIESMIDPLGVVRHLPATFAKLENEKSEQPPRKVGRLGLPSPE